MKVIFFQLSQAAIKDAAPDIYVFTFNSLKVRIVAWRMENTIFIFHLSLSLSLSQTLQSKYSPQSHQMTVAIKLVTDTIKEVGGANIIIN